MFRVQKYKNQWRIISAIRFRGKIQRRSIEIEISTYELPNSHLIFSIHWIFSTNQITYLYLHSKKFVWIDCEQQKKLLVGIIFKGIIISDLNPFYEHIFIEQSYAIFGTLNLPFLHINQTEKQFEQFNLIGLLLIFQSITTKSTGSLEVRHKVFDLK